MERDLAYLMKRQDELERRMSAVIELVKIQGEKISLLEKVAFNNNDSICLLNKLVQNSFEITKDIQTIITCSLHSTYQAPNSEQN